MKYAPVSSGGATAPVIPTQLIPPAHLSCFGGNNRTVANCITAAEASCFVGVGKSMIDPKLGSARPDTPLDVVGQHVRDTKMTSARNVTLSGEVGHKDSDAKTPRADFSPQFDTLRYLYRQWSFLTGSRIKLELNAMAYCRRMCDNDKDEGAKLYAAVRKGKEHPKKDVAVAVIAVAVQAMKPFDDNTKMYVKDIERTAKQIAKDAGVFDFIESTKGFGWKSVGVILSETGDLNNYPNPDKLKKRLGLAPHAGKAYSTWRKEGGLTADEWTAASYSPRRRSIMHVVGECLLKAQVRKETKEDGTEERKAIGDLGAVYLTAKQTYMQREGMTLIHAHNMAMRKMESELMIRLWCAWTRNKRK